MLAVALAISLIMLSVARWGGWRPSDYTISLHERR
jgi:hypothetical protein